MSLLFAALLLSLQAQSTSVGKASIEGYVVRAGTNEPVARARVSVARQRSGFSS
jgi:hypothetical protein